MFEQAARQRLRFKCTAGNLTVEDLWKLTLTNLNTLAKSLNKKLKLDEEEDFISEVKSEDVESRLKFDIVIYVINTLKAEAAQKRDAKKVKEQREEYLELLENIDKEERGSMTKEQIMAKLKELGA